MHRAPLDLTSGQFREMGHRLVDRLADFLDSLPARTVVPPDAGPDAYRALFGRRPLPDEGCDPEQLLEEATGLLLDPHKWLYAPLEAGCALVRNQEALAAAFAYRPSYYHVHHDGGSPAPNYYELGPQNSRAFRALKVWLALRQVGRAGYVQMIGDDIRLGRELFELVSRHPELEAVTQGLSITTFRYVPPGVLRACIVNFRTSVADLEALRDATVEIGREVAAQSQPHGSR